MQVNNPDSSPTRKPLNRSEASHEYSLKSSYTEYDISQIRTKYDQSLEEIAELRTKVILSPSHWLAREKTSTWRLFFSFSCRVWTTKNYTDYEPWKRKWENSICIWRIGEIPEEIRVRDFPTSEILNFLLRLLSFSSVVFVSCGRTELWKRKFVRKPERWPSYISSILSMFMSLVSRRREIRFLFA